MIKDRCIKCGTRINDDRNTTDKPSARIVCDDCIDKEPTELRTIEYQGFRGRDIEPEEVVKVYVNRVDRGYIDYDYDNNIAGPAVRVLERIKINVTAANAHVKSTMDLDISPDALVKVSGVPDYEETARQVIKQLAFGIS